MSAPTPASAAPDLDAARGVRLLFDAEIASGALDAQAALVPRALDALRPHPVHPAPWRLAQDVARKAGRLDHERANDGPLTAVRRAVLGETAAAPPRFLVRVDEFPHYKAWDEPGRYGSDGFRRFHEILRAAGVPYLIAALPRVSRVPLDPAGSDWRPLDDDEAELLREIARDGATLALHGRDHRTRFASPRRHSELAGLDAAATAALLDEGLAELAARELPRPQVFVPPYNRFDAAQLPALAERFAVLGGGPEAIRRLGFQRAPQWRDGIVYLPAYAPFYGHAREVLPAAQRAIDRRTGLWTPLVLHWGWEADAGWGDLERLCAAIAPHAVPWDDFLTAVERSR